MIHLVYVSSATGEMGEEDLLILLEQSRNRNKRQNVTGMLLFSGGNFFQILEGEKVDVEEIYDAIVNDERNRGNILILKEKINERTFSEWSMGFKYLTTLDRDSVEGYSEFLDRGMEPEAFSNRSDKVLGLLNLFKKANA